MSRENELNNAALASRIDEIIDDRKRWDAEVLATNSRLYRILSACLAVYLELEDNKAALYALAEQRGVSSNRRTDSILLILKLIFGDEDRQRLSAYAVVLRKALDNPEARADLPAWIVKHGGVEAIRTGRGKEDGGSSTDGASKCTQADKVSVGLRYLDSLQGALATIPPTPMTCNVRKEEGYVLMLGRVNGDMTTSLVSFVAAPSALKAALAAVGKEVLRASSGEPGQVIPFPAPEASQQDGAASAALPGGSSFSESLENAVQGARGA